jgi:hypothetical protein
VTKELGLEGTEGVAIRQGDLWAWVVSFLVILSLHIGIVVFVTLAIASFVYALAFALADISIGVQAVAWSFTVVSLILWGILVQKQVEGFHPRAIRGIGHVVVATSGCELGELAADIGTGLFGLAQIGPVVWSLLSRDSVPARAMLVTAFVGGMFAVLGFGSLALRLLLRRRRLGAH